MKVFHIHSDRKFANSSFYYFSDEIFDNVLVVWGNKTNYSFPGQESAYYFDHTKSDLYKLASFCEQADIIVLYNLDSWKAALANLVPDNITILWRFYGNELYNKIPLNIYSKHTKKIKTKNNTIYRLVLNSLKKLKIFFSHNKTMGVRNYNKSFERINYFMGTTDMEHEMLKSYIPTLPDFVQLPMRRKDFSKIFKNDQKTIIIGNSRSAVNNHIDILLLIQNNEHSSKYKYLLPFNYGEKSPYTEEVKKMAMKISNFTLLEEYYDAEQYYNILKSSSAIVINSYRQNALANIYEALAFGVKVYLNEANIMYRYFKSKGFYVYTISEFEKDIENENISLCEKEKLHNLDIFSSLVTLSINEYEAFIKKITTN